MTIIPINKANIPYRFQIVLGSDLFEMEIRYNQAHDFFTLDLSKDGVPLVYGERLTYGVPLFADINDSRLPKYQITPRDEAGLESDVTWQNLGTTVFLAVDSP